MCLRQNYNEVITSDNVFSMIAFSEECETMNCAKFGSCDYLGFLDDEIKEMERKLNGRL